MRTAVIFFGIVLSLSGCGEEQSTTSRAANTSPEVSDTLNAQTVFKDCMDVCGDGENAFTKTCYVSCWNDLAIATVDAAKCEKNLELIDSSPGYNVCVESVARASGDASACGLIKAQMDQALCYVELAKRLNDPSVCDQVEEGGVPIGKQDCLNALK